MKFNGHLLTRSLCLSALRVALAVGSALLLINQFDALLGREPLRILPALLTYCVPFTVFIAGKLSSAED